MDTVVLTPTQKAAAILVAIGKSRASRLIGMFKRHELRLLVDGARSLRSIPQPDLEMLVESFEAEFAEGAGLLDSGETMDNILNEGLTEEERETLGKPEEKPKQEDIDETDVWKTIEAADPKVIANYLSKQSAQTIALVCSKLSTSKTGAILPLLDEEMRKSVFARILSMHNVSPTTMALLERNLSSAFQSASAASGSAEAPVRLAGILNEVDRAEADLYLSEIRQSVGEAKAAAVQSHLFRFEDIPRLDPSARTTIFDGMSVDLIVMALRGAEPDLRETIMSAVGQRSRRMIESELGNEVTVRADDVKSAQRAIISTIMKLAHEGRIEMHAEEERKAA